MEVGPQSHQRDGILGPTSIIVVYVDPLELLGSKDFRALVYINDITAHTTTAVDISMTDTESRVGIKTLNPKPQTLNPKPKTINPSPD